MKPERKYKILKAIANEEKFSRNNRDMAYLHANGYIEVTGVEQCSYLHAKITLSAWGRVMLKSLDTKD